jgi:hypothetical protein
MMYMNGFSADVTVKAAKEVFRFANAAKGHSPPNTRVTSVTKGYSDAALKGTARLTEDLSISKLN